MPSDLPVLLGPPAASGHPADPDDPIDLADLTAGARARAGQDAGLVLGWAAEVGSGLPLPGRGRTLRLWEALASVGAADLTVARVLEPHLDALAVLAQAEEVDGPARPGESPEPGGPGGGRRTWGVWAAEGRGARLAAHAGTDGTWVLEGRKPWCSLAGQVSHALVTAWIDDDPGAPRRGLFAVALDEPGVQVEAGAWSRHALAGITTSTVALRGVPAVPVGGPGWYVTRPGFAWGGLGVAAVWYGGAVGLARRLRAAAAEREPDQVGLTHLGAVDAALWAARQVLAAAAADVDAGRADGVAGTLLAARGRQVVADAVETVLARVGHALGPGPLAHEPEHAQRVADLTLYVRQHHAERDQAALGRSLLADPGTPAW